MNKHLTAIKSASILAVILILAGCAQSQTRPYEADQIASEIERLEAIVALRSEPQSISQAHLDLARLYLSHRNPSRDYGKSLENLEAYLRTGDVPTTDPDVLNWVAALQEIEQLKSRLADTAKENARLTAANKALGETNRSLTQTIEILKALDQGVEEKRRNYKSD